MAVLASFSWSTSFIKPKRTPASFARKFSRCRVAISCLATSRRRLRAQSSLGDRNLTSTVTCFPNCILSFCKICAALFLLYSIRVGHLYRFEDLIPLELLQNVSGRGEIKGAYGQWIYPSKGVKHILVQKMRLRRFNVGCFSLRGGECFTESCIPVFSKKSWSWTQYERQGQA